MSSLIPRSKSREASWTAAVFSAAFLLPRSLRQKRHKQVECPRCFHAPNLAKRLGLRLSFLPLFCCRGAYGKSVINKLNVLADSTLQISRSVLDCGCLFCRFFAAAELTAKAS